MTEENNDGQAAAVYTQPTTVVDMEERLARERGEELPGDVGRDFSGGRSPEELDGFVGVSPEYRNFANETDRPLFSDDRDGPEAEFEQRHTDASDRIVVGPSEAELNAWDADREAAFGHGVADQPSVPSEPPVAPEKSGHATGSEATAPVQTVKTTSSRAGKADTEKK